MSVALTLLGLVGRPPRHGYELKRDHDAHFGKDKPLPFGQVYSTLAGLTRDGMVVSDVEPGDGPDGERYAITDPGEAEVEGWIAELVEPEPHLQRRFRAVTTL